MQHSYDDDGGKVVGGTEYGVLYTQLVQAATENHNPLIVVDPHALHSFALGGKA